MRSAHDLLMGSGGKTAKFASIGDCVEGEIVCEPEATQQKDFTTEKPKFFDNGDPMMQVVVTLQSEARDPQDPEDDGMRKVYLKAGSLKAVRGAIKAAKSKKLEVGGWLGLYFTSEGTPTKPGLNPPKNYEAVYAPPGAAKAQQVLATGDGPARPDSVSVEQWAQMSAEQRMKVAAAFSS